jgi:hypothetical protein
MMDKESTNSKNSKGGRRPGAGRPKGSLDKGNAAIREMVVQALHEEGGVTYLRGLAQSHPTAFVSLVSKVMPVQVDANVTTQQLPASVDEFV